MTRRLLLAAAAFAAVALPVSLAHADDPPVVTAPPVAVASPPDYCYVVIVVDGPGPSATVLAACGVDVTIPIVLNGPAEVAPVAVPVAAARLGYVPSWVELALGR